MGLCMMTSSHNQFIGYFGAAGGQDEVLIASYETFRNHAREVGRGGEISGPYRWPSIFSPKNMLHMLKRFKIG